MAESSAQSTVPVDLHFMVPGFSKCGTTSLCSLLAAHPKLFVPSGPRKEPNFFSQPHHETRWDDYVSKFHGAPVGALLGEGSTAYSTYRQENEARQRILRTYPEVRLIFIARDPMARIESSFREFHHTGSQWGIAAPFDLLAAMKSIPQLLEDTAYGRRLDNYRPHLRADQLLVIFLEDLVAEPEVTLARCFAFLGVDDTVRIPRPARRLNPGESKLHDTPRLRELRNGNLNPDTARALASLPTRIQDQLLEKLGLRRPLGAVEWTREEEAHVIEAIGDDCLRFLEREGRPTSLWPRFAAALERCG